VVLDELQLLGREIHVPLLEGVLVRVGGRAIERGDELHGQRAVVADLLERADDLLPVARAHPAGHAVVVGDVEVDEATLRGADGLVHVALLDVQVEHVEADAAVGPDFLGQQQRLVVAVEEVRLEAVERLERQLHALALAVLVALLQALDGPLPLVLGRALRLHLAHRGRDDRDLDAPELLDHRDAVVHVLHRRGALRFVLRQQVALREHQRDGSPAPQAGVLEQLADVSRVVALGLSADLDGAVAARGQAGNRGLNGFRPHPVVHRDVHEQALRR